MVIKGIQGIPLIVIVCSLTGPSSQRGFLSRIPILDSFETYNVINSNHFFSLSFQEKLKVYRDRQPQLLRDEINGKILDHFPICSYVFELKAIEKWIFVVCTWPPVCFSLDHLPVEWRTHPTVNTQFSIAYISKTKLQIEKWSNLSFGPLDVESVQPNSTIFKYSVNQQN